MNLNTSVTDKGSLANPNPLGLCASGMATMLLNFQNAGFFEMDAMILAMALFYGGMAQIVAGVIAAKRKSVFGFTAFTSYGFFWLSLTGVLVLPKLGWAAAPTEAALGAYFGVWGVFTLLLFFGSLQYSKAIQFVFASTALLFFLLVASESSGSTNIRHIAGYEGIICGASAIYTGLAAILNGVFNRVILPIGSSAAE